MPFTKQQISGALATINEKYPGFDIRRVFKDKNYKPIEGYLTGNSKTLNIVFEGDYFSYWVGLLSLIRNLDPVSPDEQLVLDIIHHPNIHPSLKWSFKEMLMEFVIAHPTKQGFYAALKQFSNMPMTEDDIYDYLIYRMDFGLVDLQTDTPLKNFLVKNTLQKTKLKFPGFFQDGTMWHSYHQKWFVGYFNMLEEVNPKFADEYLQFGLIYREIQVGTLLAQYKNGLYAPVLTDFIKTESTDIDKLESKFKVALGLFRADKSVFKSLFQEVCWKYLDRLAETPGKKNDRHFESNEPIVDAQSYVYISTYAIHFLLTCDKEKLLEKIETWLKEKKHIQLNSLSVLYQHLGDDSLFYFGLALNAEENADFYFCRNFTSTLLEHFKPEQYVPLIWELSGSKLKNVRQLAAKTIAENDKDAENKAIGLLKSKNGEVKQTAALVLSRFATATAKEAVLAAINTEQSDNARDILLETIEECLPKESDHAYITGMVEAAAKRGKLKKPVEAWLEESLLPPLYYAATEGTSSKKLTDMEVRFLLYRMSRIKAMRQDIEARYIIQLLDKEKAAPFAMDLIKLFIQKEAKPDYKYLMALAALLGNDPVVEKIKTTVNKWIEDGRYKMAVFGIEALVLHGSDKALRYVEWFGRKYKNNKATVGQAAMAALENAAEVLGITIYELGDKIVPDFGFDGLFKTFTAGGEEYRAFIDSNFKLAYFNEDNKMLKCIPSGVDKATKEEFAGIGKEVKSIVKLQSSRLEYYLIIQRRWTPEQWQKFFMQNPIMFIYAIKLLWGVYDGDTIVATFICNEDTSLQNIDGEEIALPDGNIGIVHPSQLPEEILNQWKRYFFDNSIIPIIPQLQRPEASMEGIDLEKAIVSKFEGRQMKAGSIRATLEKHGWNKGRAGEGRMVDSFNLVYPEKKIEAILKVEGVGVSYGWSDDEKLGILYVVDKTKAGNDGYYGVNEDTGYLIKLKDVPVIFLYEMIAAVEAITPFGLKAAESKDDDF